MTLKRCYVHLPDFTGVGYYRAILAVRHCQDDLRKEGIDLHLSTTFSSWDKYDAYIFHRVYAGNFLPQVMKLKGQGCRIVWETDDDLLNVPELSISRLKDEERCQYQLGAELADLILCSTDPLRQAIGKQDKTLVVPNLIDLTEWPKPRERVHPNIRILWAGSPTHEGDLEQLVEPIGRLIEEYGPKIAFIFFGYMPGAIASRYYGRGAYFTNPVALTDYIPSLMTIQPDIALCPLVDDPFNRAKSAIKWYEMSFAGAAVVASDVGPYKAICHSHDGFLVGTKEIDGWYRCIKRLIDNALLRADVVAAARKRIANEFSWQSSAKQVWMDAFRKCVE